MTDENVNASETVPEAPEKASPKQEEQTVILVSYPKIVFLYPTLIAALICGMYMWISGTTDVPEKPAVVAADGAAADSKAADGDA